MNIDTGPMRAVLAPIRTVSGVDGFAHAAAVSFGQVFGAAKAVYVERQANTAAGSPLSPDDVHFIHWPAWCQPHYCRHVRHHDPIRRWLASADAQGDGSVAVLSDLVPTRRLLQAAYYTDMMRPGDARYVMTLIVRDQGAVVGALSLVRDARAEDFTAQERALAQTLAPVLELAHAVAIERSGRAMPPPRQAGLAAGALASLTPRERQVMQLVVQGHPNKTIARLLDASPWTVKNHLRAIFDKAQVTNRTALCALAMNAARPPSLPH